MEAWTSRGADRGEMPRQITGVPSSNGLFEGDDGTVYGQQEWHTTYKTALFAAMREAHDMCNKLERLQDHAREVLRR